MRLAKTMNAEQFAELLFNLEVDETVEFGLEKSNYTENSPLEVLNVENWFFAKRMKINEYESEFFLIDFCGGASAYAIPVWPELDESAIKFDVKRLFKYLSDYQHIKVDEVYVDMGEQED